MSTLEENKKTVKKIQEIVFRIMCDIDDFCKENGIRYYLSGGTCLGAVRHGGFIPWDDDGDLMMPRRDYERFLDLFPRQFSGKYGIGAFSLNPKWQRQYARVWDLRTIWKSTNLDDITMGVFIDIFPIDGLPNGELRRKVYYGRLKLLSAMGSAAVKKEFLPGEKYRGIKRIAGLFLKPLGIRRFTMKMEQLAKKYDFDTSRYVGVSMAAHYGDRETIEGDEMRKETRLLFEGKEFPVPVGYKQYLSNLYGDYMTIPEGVEEKGYSHLDHWEIKFME